MCCSAKTQAIDANRMHRIFDRMIGFKKRELEQLRKTFLKMSSGNQLITRALFKDNMGVLGLKTVQSLSNRVFHSFDLDNDGTISWQDFIQYMDIVKNGQQRQKASISFRIIDLQSKGEFGLQEFRVFLVDVIESWCTITNTPITKQLQEQSHVYIRQVFEDISKEKYKQGQKQRCVLKQQKINQKDYYETLYKDSQFVSIFQFIIEGMSGMFIRQKNFQKQEQIMKQIIEINHKFQDIYHTIYLKQKEQKKKEQTHLLIQNVEQIKPPKKKSALVIPQEQNIPATLIINPAPLIHQFKEQNTPQLLKTVKATSKSWKQPLFFKQMFRFSQVDDLRRKKLKHQKIDQEQNQNQRSQQSISLLPEWSNYIEEIKPAFETALKQLEQLKQKINNQILEHMVQKDLGKVRLRAVANVHKKNPGDYQKNMVFIGHDNWNLVLNMMIGIRMAVRSIKGYQQMIYDDPKDFKLKYYFELIPRRIGNQKQNIKICKFMDYAPNTFNRIRNLFDINVENYLGSIGPDKLLTSLLMGEINSLAQLTSQGKSGSLFYYSADGKYMLKTISNRQFHFFRKILKPYYYHLKSNPQTLMTKFYGLHKLIQTQKGNKTATKTYFVIMANVFTYLDKIHKRYDIKGSLYGRITNDTDSRATRKDLNFIQQKLKLSVSETFKQKFLQQIQRDCAFFEKHTIIDYSLLIGIHLQQQPSRIHKTMSVKNDSIDQDFIVSLAQTSSTENKDKYFFGIIDILTQYDTKKKLQYYFKSCIYGQTISAVPPPNYSHRFKMFLKERVV